MSAYIFSESQKSAISQFRDHLVFIQGARNTFETLFDDKAHVHILAASAEAFFGDLNSILINYLYLTFARLTDPFDANHENFTVEYLHKMQKWNDPEKSRLALLMQEMTAFRSCVVLPRNKIIAHNDLKTYLTPGKVIGGFPEGADLKFLRNVQEFVQIVFEQAFGTTYGDIGTTMSGDALDLIRFLRMGIPAESSRSVLSLISFKRKPSSLECKRACSKAALRHHKRRLASIRYKNLVQKNRLIPNWLFFPLLAGIGTAAYIEASILGAETVASILVIAIYLYIGVVWALNLFRSRVDSLLEGLSWYLLANLAVVGHFCMVYFRVGLLDRFGVLTQKIGIAAYFSVLVWAGASYGDLMPTPKARPWVAVETVLGYISLAFLISLIILVVEKTRKRPKPKRPHRKKRSWRSLT